MIHIHGIVTATAAMREYVFSIVTVTAVMRDFEYHDVVLTHAENQPVIKQCLFFWRSFAHLLGGSSKFWCTSTSSSSPLQTKPPILKHDQDG